MSNTSSQQNTFFEKNDTGNTIINLGEIKCESIADVVRSDAALEFVEKVSTVKSDIIEGILVGENDFRKIKDIYKRVYVDGEKILTKEDHDVLLSFLTSQEVKQYFIRLLDEDHLSMSGTSKKTRALTNDILQLASNDREKLSPVIEYLLKQIKENKHVGDNIVFGYNFTSSHRTHNSRNGPQRDKELELYSHKALGKDTYGLVLIEDGKIIESQCNDYTQIQDTQECGGIKIMKARKDSGEGYLAIINSEIVEISSFDFTHRPDLSEEKSIEMRKETGKGMAYFDGKKLQELTSFEYKSIDKNNSKKQEIFQDIYELKKQDNTFDVLKLGKSGEKIFFSDEGIEEIREFHSHKSIPKGTAITRVRRGKEWGFIILSGDQITSFGPQDYTKIDYFNKNDSDSEQQVTKKEDGYGVTSIIGGKITDITSFDFTSIGEIEEVHGLKLRQCTKKIGEGFMYKTPDGWKETTYDMKRFQGMEENEGIIIADTVDKKQRILLIGRDGITVHNDTDYDSVKYKGSYNFKECIITDGKKQQYICLGKGGNIFSSKMEYIDIQDFDDKGFAVAKKETGYGLLKKEGESIEEKSSFDFNTLSELYEYRDYVLEKKQGFGVVNFSNTGLRELSGFDYLDIDPFNEENLAIAKKKTGNGIIKKTTKQEVIETTKDFAYEYWQLESILSDGHGLYEVQKGEGKDVLRYTADGIFSVFDFEIEDIHKSGFNDKRFLIKKQGAAWGFVQQSKDRKEIIIPDAFDFDDPWDLDSDQPQSITREGKRYMIRNTETGIEVVMDLSEYISIDPNINEGQIKVAEKESGVGVVMMKDGKLQDVSEFIYDEIGVFNSSGLSVVKKDGKTGLLLFNGKQISEVSMIGERLIGEAKEQTSFAFSDIELEKEGKIPGAYLVTGTLRDGKTKVILRYFEGVIEQISKTSFSEVGEKDENNIMICRESNNHACVMFIDYEQQGIGKGKIHSLEIGDEEYVNIEHVTKKWYIGETKQGTKKILLCQGNSMEVGEVGFESLLFHKDTGLCEGRQKDGGGIGYFFLKDNKIESHIDFGLSEPIDMRNISTPQVIPRNDRTSSIISFTGGMFYEVFQGDVEEIESDVKIKQGNLVLFKNSEELWGCFQCVLQLGGIKLHIVVPPSHKEGIMTKKGGEVHIPQEGILSFGRTECIFPKE